MVNRSDCTLRFAINSTDKDLFTALDLAILHGWYKTYDILKASGAISSANGEMLLRTCLSKKYYETAQRLLRDKLAVVTDEMISVAPNGELAKWLSERSTEEGIPIRVCIDKGMLDAVASRLDEITPITLKDYLGILLKPSAQHIKIFELLFDNNKADPRELIEIIGENEPEGSNRISTWPLFIYGLCIRQRGASKLALQVCRRCRRSTGHTSSLHKRYRQI
jgi:hypothetical protein